MHILTMGSTGGKYTHTCRNMPHTDRSKLTPVTRQVSCILEGKHLTLMMIRFSQWQACWFDLLIHKRSAWCVLLFSSKEESHEKIEPYHKIGSCFCFLRELLAHTCLHMQSMDQRELRALWAPYLWVCLDSRTLTSLVRWQIVTSPHNIKKKEKSFLLSLLGIFSQVTDVPLMSVWLLSSKKWDIKITSPVHLLNLCFYSRLNRDYQG